ncbi:MAG: hypothetical protein A7315_05635 [Candidatus Altiarchaeales archaeon WOR_SM1_79]|nr:MAG: hypothetical protein A7315_05635 [Candidatus Altiarchaeales archaeon WOR_SM1_79]
MEWPKNIDIGLKEDLLVYETDKPEIKREMLYELAKRFEINGDIQSNEDVYIISQKERVSAIYKSSGAFWYADFAKLNHPDYKPELPSKDEATKIAKEYLKRNEWLPKGAILDSVHINISERVEGKEREKRTKYLNNVCVNLRFSLNNINTYGPGAKIKVFIGHKGEVIGLFHAWRTVHEHKKFPALSRRDIEDVLRHKLGVSLEGIEVKGVNFAYHAESCVLNSRFVQPVYVFELVAPAKSKRQDKPTRVEFETHPLPATTFAPIVTIKSPSSPIEIKQGEPLKLSCDLRGGTPPFKFSWDSNMDGHLSDEEVLSTKELSIAHRGGRVTSHTIKVTVTDAHGMQDSHHVLVKVHPREGTKLTGKKKSTPNDPEDPYVGVEWCNIYHGLPGLADISGTDTSAQGFNNYIKGLPNWSSRFDWGNDAAWEQDFKFATAPGGGTDSFWADNVHFAFFAGHGSSGRFWFGSAVDDHEMRAQDARWGDGILNWIALHACQTMRANFEWTVWCDAFNGLHMMLGFHTNTEGSTPPLGSRFAFWMSFKLPWMSDSLFDIRTAWKLACEECFDSSREYAVIYAGQSGTDTYNDHLSGYGYVSPDPTSPYYWVYYKRTC